MSFSSHCLIICHPLCFPCIYSRAVMFYFATILSHAGNAIKFFLCGIYPIQKERSKSFSPSGYSSSSIKSSPKNSAINSYACCILQKVWDIASSTGFNLLWWPFSRILSSLIVADCHIHNDSASVLKVGTQARILCKQCTMNDTLFCCGNQQRRINSFE